MMIWRYEGAGKELMSAFANEESHSIVFEEAEKKGKPVAVIATLTSRAKTVSQHRRACATASFTVMMQTVSAADAEASALVAFGSGESSTAVVSCFGIIVSMFWWNVRLCDVGDVPRQQLAPCRCGTVTTNARSRSAMRVA